MILIDTSTVDTFEPLANAGNTIPIISGTLTEFSGGNLNWTVEARCQDDLVCPAAWGCTTQQPIPSTEPACCPAPSATTTKERTSPHAISGPKQAGALRGGPPRVPWRVRPLFHRADGAGGGAAGSPSPRPRRRPTPQPPARSPSGTRRAPRSAAATPRAPASSSTRAIRPPRRLAAASPRTRCSSTSPTATPSSAAGRRPPPSSSRWPPPAAPAPRRRSVAPWRCGPPPRWRLRRCLPR